MRLRGGDPPAVELTRAIQYGDVGSLQRLLHERPDLASTRIEDENGCSRTPLHVVPTGPGISGTALRSLACSSMAGLTRTRR